MAPDMSVRLFAYFFQRASACISRLEYKCGKHLGVWRGYLGQYTHVDVLIAIQRSLAILPKLAMIRNGVCCTSTEHTWVDTDDNSASNSRTIIIGKFGVRPETIHNSEGSGFPCANGSPRISRQGDSYHANRAHP